MKNIIKYVSILCITLSVSSCISTKSTIKNIDDNAPNLTLTKSNTFVITDYSQDPKYGYDADYPVNVFYKNSKGEDINAHRFLNALAGPKGEKITLKGSLSARLFKQNQEAHELEPESDLSDLK